MSMDAIHMQEEVVERTIRPAITELRVLQKELIVLNSDGMMQRRFPAALQRVDTALTNLDRLLVNEREDNFV